MPARPQDVGMETQTVALAVQPSAADATAHITYLNTVAERLTGWGNLDNPRLLGIYRERCSCTSTVGSVNDSRLSASWGMALEVASVTVKAIVWPISL